MLLFLVTPCLVKTVQPCMKWIPTFKKWSPTTYLIPNDKKNTNEVSQIEKVYITFHTHQTSGMCAGSCTCNHTHQMVKTDKSVIQLVFKCVPLRPLLCKSLFCHFVSQDHDAECSCHMFITFGKHFLLNDSHSLQKGTQSHLKSQFPCKMT